MSQITVFMPARHTVDGLKALRNLGVLHVRHYHERPNEGITSLQRRIQDIAKARALVPHDVSQKDSFDALDAVSVSQRILALEKQRQAYSAQLEELQNQLAWFSHWGDISVRSVHVLAHAGLSVRLYACDAAYAKALKNDPDVFFLQKQKGTFLAALITAQQNRRLEAREIELPAQDKKVLEKKAHDIHHALAEGMVQLEQLAAYRHVLCAHQQELEKKLEFNKTHWYMAHNEAFAYIGGFCPADRVADMEKLAAVQGWAVLAQEPVNTDEVPTLLKNPGWVRIINPLVKFMGVLPGYAEVDISMWFLIFFSLFFALLIGDAGYGVLFLITTAWMRKKFPRAPREVCMLLFVLSAATIVWGAVTGTWFGFEGIARLPVFRNCIIPQISAWSSTSAEVIKFLCLTLGVVHLSLAHGIAAVSRGKLTAVLAECGWLGVLWGIYFFVIHKILDTPLSPLTVPFLTAGMSAIFLFSHMQKNIFKGIILSVAGFPLKAVGFFGDVISYLRLFAVGYASFAMATSFNAMALGLPMEGFPKGLIAAVILFFGHALNIILGMMAIIVHGARLNLLEFAGHVGLQWAGSAYRAFKED